MNVERERAQLARNIRSWMVNNVGRFVDECDEVNATEMVETWDRECAQGGDTLDPDHVAWEVAVRVAESENERRARVDDPSAGRGSR